MLAKSADHFKLPKSGLSREENVPGAGWNYFAAT
jgi:hypothetical protein